jgi:hypothetical protein
MDSFTSTSEGKHSEHTYEDKLPDYGHIFENRAIDQNNREPYYEKYKNLKYEIISADEHMIVLRKFNKLKQVTI